MLANSRRSRAFSASNSDAGRFAGGKTAPSRDSESCDAPFLLRTQFVTVDCGTPSRLAAALPPIAPGGPLIRVFRGYAAAGGHQGTVRSIAMDSAGYRAVSAGNSSNDQSSSSGTWRPGRTTSSKGRRRQAGGRHSR